MPSRTTPVATPVPGLVIVIGIWISLPMSTGWGGTASIRRSGLVARERADASARKVTLATLPTSPSTIGITSIATRAWPPGGRVPSIQTMSPVGPEPDAAVIGLAGGEVATSDVP